MKKTITIEVPDGLPDGWECCGYGKPLADETMHHVNNEWRETPIGHYGPHYLIARRTETPADWANKQPKLGALANMMVDGNKIKLFVDGNHYVLGDCDSEIEVVAEKCQQAHNSEVLVAESGKWVNA